MLSETMELVFRPYYFVDYHCFSQHTVRGASALLESKGKVVIDAVSGQVADCVASVGQKPSIAATGTYVSCSEFPPQTLTSANLPAQLHHSVVGHEVDSARAKEIAKIELVKSLSLQAVFQTTRTKGTVLLKPPKKDVDILNVQGPVKIPFLFATYHSQNYAYVRQCLASTGKMTLDQTASCLACRNPAFIVCENCGGLACESHNRACVVCGKNLCGTCTISKGVISKKHYCTQHQPG